jgi:hypothetical protein
MMVIDCFLCCCVADVTSGKVDWKVITWDELCKRRVGKWLLFGEGTVSWLDYLLCNMIVGVTNRSGGGWESKVVVGGRWKGVFSLL